MVFLTVSRTGPAPHLEILPGTVYWYFPLRNVLYYSLYAVRTLPLRWSILTKVVKLVRNVSYLTWFLSKVRFLLVYEDNGSL